MVRFRSLLSNFRPRIPKLRSLIAALVVIGCGWALQHQASHNPDLDQKLRTIIGQIERDLRLVDATLLTGTFWSLSSDRLWNCRDCTQAQQLCAPSPWNQHLEPQPLARSLRAPPPVGSAAPESILAWSDSDQCRLLRYCAGQPQGKQCKGFDPIGLWPGTWLESAVQSLTILWHDFHWSVFLFFAVSAGLAAALICSVYRVEYGSWEPGFLIYLTPLAAAPVALVLKWLLIGALALLGPAIGLVVWLAGIVKSLSWAFGAVGSAYKAYKLANKIESVFDGGPVAPAAGPASPADSPKP